MAAKIQCFKYKLCSMFVAMTIHEASQQLLFQLFHLYDEREAKNIADWIMENITGWKKIDRVVNKNVPLSAMQENLLKQYTHELQLHKPVQYVLHEAWFYKMKLYVDENVLIPRPETEELVEWVIAEVGNQKSEAGSMLDIGTGSGCIPLALKKNLAFFDIHSCDISEGALEVARRNAIEQQLEIQFHLLNILSEEERTALPQFDIIVSNPPYIPQKDKTTMAANILNYEPHLALFVKNNDPLIFYKAIADFATTHLKKAGSIYLEIHEDFGNEVINLFKEKNYNKIELKKDLQGKDRMIKILNVEM
jgi:release factor glutamine methyltransferase